MMASKTLLYLSATHCQACTWQDGALAGTQYFSGDSEGRKQFGAYLHTHRAPTLLLVDLVEEDFREEAIPHLRGGERSALIERKLEQYYRDTPFRQATILRRRSEGRRDDETLFSALTNPALISPWLDMLLAHGTPLAGIYSVPNISAPLAKNVPHAKLLLLSWQEHAGLRQTYFDAQTLRFSRLTPLHGNSFGAAAAAEVARTQQYLKNLGLLPPGSALEVRVICHASDRPQLEAHLCDAPDLRYAYLDIRTLEKRIGARTDCHDSDATPLFLHLLATQPPRSHYATPGHTHFHQLTHVRRALFGLSATLAAGSLLWTASNLMQGSALQQEIQSLDSQALRLSQQAKQIVRRFPAAQANATDMKTAVSLSRQLDRLSPPPKTLLEGLSRSLDAFPDIRIARLSWQASPENASTATAPAPLILLEGELEGFSGDYRAALERLQNFQQALLRHGYGVTPVSLPLDVSPQGNIAGSTADSSSRAPFALKLSWRSPM